VAWRRAWNCVIPFFAFPPGVRMVIYTTNAALNTENLPPAK
jgi:putative transposase